MIVSACKGCDAPKIIYRRSLKKGVRRRTDSGGYESGKLAQTEAWSERRTPRAASAGRRQARGLTGRIERHGKMSFYVWFDKFSAIIGKRS